MTSRANATRTLLEAVVTQEPGLNKSELCQRLGLAWGTVHHHLAVLEREGRVQRQSTPWETLVFPPQLDPRHATWLAALRTPIRRNLVRKLELQPTAEAAQLAEGVGLSRRMVQRHLTSLGRAGILQREGTRSARYLLNPQVRTLVRDLLARGAA